MTEKAPLLEIVDQIREDNKQRETVSNNTKQELGDAAITSMAMLSAGVSAS